MQGSRRLNKRLFDCFRGRVPLLGLRSHLLVQFFVRLHGLFERFAIELVQFTDLTSYHIRGSFHIANEQTDLAEVVAIFQMANL